MKLNYYLLFFISVWVLILVRGQDPALKINLNPPEESANDTIGKSLSYLKSKFTYQRP
jgi:hypothetical protein